MVAVFKYRAVSRTDTEHLEHKGTVLADDKIQAFHKLTQRQLTDIKLKRLKGLDAWVARLRPDIS